ncbi:MAG: redoxin domain-containing protein [Bdellovibrionales bacterium]|nr:redoxin domain-containing protein [Bdellovibrionales bacterium]
MPTLFLFLTLLAGADAHAAVPAEFRKPGLQVVAFLSSRCPCSAAHEPTLATLAKKYEGQVKFIGIHSNVDENTPEDAEYFRKGALPFEVKRDSKALLADAFGAVKTPHVFVLQDGKIRYAGGVDDSKDPVRSEGHYLADALEALIQGRKPPRNQARALGCIIRRNS